MFCALLFLDRCLNLHRFGFVLSLAESGDASDEKSSLETEDPRLETKRNWAKVIPSTNVTINLTCFRGDVVSSNREHRRESTGNWMKMLLRRLKFFSPKNHLVWIKKSSHLSHGEGNLNCLFIHLLGTVLALWPLCYHLSCTWKKSENGRSLIMVCKRMLIVFIAMLKIRCIEWLGLSWLEKSMKIGKGLGSSLFMQSE